MSGTPTAPGRHAIEVTAENATGTAATTVDLIIASTGAVADASVAVDPATDAALAAWRVGSAGTRVEFALGAGAGRYRPRIAVVPAPQGGGTHWLRIALAALALIALALGAGLLRARARRRAAR